MYQFLVLFTGICKSVMIFSNGSLESYIGNYPTLIIIHIIGLFMVVTLSLTKKHTPTIKKGYNKWYLCAGTIGILVITLNNKMFALGGVIFTLSGTLTGQVLTALLIEIIKNIKTHEKLYLGKIISLILIVSGTIIIGTRSNLAFYWILLSWVPGMLIMFQSYMNSQNILFLGFKRTFFLHFGITLVLLLIFLFFKPISKETIKTIFSGTVPIQYVFGGGIIAVFIVSMGGYLLLKIKPITYVLLLYSGQLGSAILIDYTQGLPLSIEKVIALGLIIIGLIIGEKKS